MEQKKCESNECGSEFGLESYDLIVDQKSLRINEKGIKMIFSKCESHSVVKQKYE